MHTSSNTSPMAVNLNTRPFYTVKKEKPAVPPPETEDSATTEESVCGVKTLIVPCNHSILCVACSIKLGTSDRTCPSCRRPFKRIKRIYSYFLRDRMYDTVATSTREEATTQDNLAFIWAAKMVISPCFSGFTLGTTPSASLMACSTTVYATACKFTM